MERLQAFEEMLRDVLSQYEREKQAMDQMKARGKEKTATYRQYMGNRLMYGRMLDLYRQYGLLKEASGQSGQASSSAGRNLHDEL